MHVQLDYPALTHSLPLLLVLVEDGELELGPYILVLSFGPRDQHQVERNVVTTLVIQTTRVHTKTPERWAGRKEEEREGREGGEGGRGGREGVEEERENERS